MGRNRAAVALLALALLASGCLDHRPPERSALVLGLGLDVDPEDETQVVVTQLIVIPSSVAAGSENPSPQPGTAFFLLSSKATTLEIATAAAVQKLSRIPAYAHMDALVMGEDFARLGRSVEPAVAWAMRHPEIRPNMFVFVADVSAQYFLDAQSSLDPLPGEALSHLMDHAEMIPFVYPVRLFEFARGLASPRQDSALPYVDRTAPADVQVPPGFQQQLMVDGTMPNVAQKTQVQLKGMAIFKGPRMVGLLTAGDGNGLRWIYGGARSSVSIEHPTVPGAYIVANTVSSSTKRRARFEGEELVLSIEIRATMDAWGLGTTQPVELGSFQDEVHRRLAAAIEADVRRTMARLQELKADIFGFGDALYRSAPRDWEKVEQVWDDLYSEARVDVRVDVILKRTGFVR